MFVSAGGAVQRNWRSESGVELHLRGSEIAAPNAAEGAPNANQWSHRDGNGSTWTWAFVLDPEPLGIIRKNLPFAATTEKFALM